MHHHADHWAASAETLFYLTAFFMYAWVEVLLASNFLFLECNADGERVRGDYVAMYDTDPISL
jgi:hypothetical protein